MKELINNKDIIRKNDKIDMQELPVEELEKVSGGGLQIFSPGTPNDPAPGAGEKDEPKDGGATYSW